MKHKERIDVLNNKISKLNNINFYIISKVIDKCLLEEYINKLDKNISVQHETKES